MTKVITAFVIIFIILIGVAPGLSAFWLDPTIDSRLHSWFIGSATALFLFSEYFINQTTKNLGLLKTPDYLSQSEKRKYAYRIRASVNHINTYIIASLSLKAVMAIAIPILAISTIDFTWRMSAWLLGYMALGVSIAIMVFSFVSRNRIYSLRINLEDEIDRERGRRKVLNNIRVQAATQEPRAFSRPVAHRISKS